MDEKYKVDVNNVIFVSNGHLLNLSKAKSRQFYYVIIDIKTEKKKPQIRLLVRIRFQWWRTSYIEFYGIDHLMIITNNYVYIIDALNTLANHANVLSIFCISRTISHRRGCAPVGHQRPHRLLWALMHLCSLHQVKLYYYFFL